MNRSVIAAIMSYVRADWDEQLSSTCCALRFQYIQLYGPRLKKRLEKL